RDREARLPGPLPAGKVPALFRRQSAEQRMRGILGTFMAAIVGAAIMSADATAAGEPENTLYLEVPTGRVAIEMRPDLAPNHVARIKELARQGFYDGVPFHRV